MARKTKASKEPQKNVFQIEVSKFSFGKEKYIEQLARYIEEHLKGTKAKKDGNFLNVELPLSFTKKNLKMIADKALYQTGVKGEFRLVSSTDTNHPGYKVV